MKIAYASDCHIEFNQLELFNTENADLLILAGDIILGDDLFEKGEVHYLDDREFTHKRSERYHSFFQQVCEEFPNVIYIFGNHEYYHGDFATTFSVVKEKLSYLKNLHILEKEKFIINDVTFLCGTMWTDFNNGDETAMRQIGYMMNDYQLVKNTNKEPPDGYRTADFTTQDAYNDFQSFWDFAVPELKTEDNKKIIMVTHHCPSKICVPEKYQGDIKMNPGYVSELDEFILDNPKITHWVCGHSHRRLDEMIGSTNILMNCRGYKGREEMADNFELKYFEV